ncbi:hypothetical protein ACU8V3_11095 [Cobetia marina]
MKRVMLAATLLAAALGTTTAHAEKIVFAMGEVPTVCRARPRSTSPIACKPGSAMSIRSSTTTVGSWGMSASDPEAAPGSVDLAAISSVMSSVSPSFALFDMPFMVKDREHLKRIDDAIVMTDLAEDAKSKGLKLVSTWENGFRQITNNEHPMLRQKTWTG